MVPLTLPQAGDRIDCFELEEVIGIGGMGAVFHARDSKLDREVALKLIPQEQSDDPEVVQRFYQEGRSAARLDHENIARVYTIGRDGPFHYIAFEYIAGETLRRRLDQSGPLGVGEAVNITLQIAAALVHASERGVVHRDIKPSNIILTPKGRAKLVDMGLARQFEREDDNGLTQSGMTLGTFDYISPEQARDPRDVDVRSDLYSLGCTLFHMLTGRPPFVGGTVLQKLLQHQEEPPPDARDFNPEVPSELASVLAKLLAKDPDRRYQTPEQLVRDLLVFGGSAETDLAPQEVSRGSPHWLDPQATWVGHLVWALPVLAFVLVITGLVWWGRDLNGPSIVPPSANPSYEADTPILAKGESLARPGTGPNSYPSKAGESRSELGGGPAATKDLTVSPDEDLLSRIASAPPRSVIILSENGPYRIGGRRERRGGFAPLKNLDLTIRAKPGVHPIVTLESASLQGDSPVPAILDFVGGRVAIEGIEFVVDAEGWESTATAIRADETQLTLSRCTFRTLGDKGVPLASALRIRSAGSTDPIGDRPPFVQAVRSHFQGGREAIVAEGPVDIVLQDCTIEANGPSLSIDNGRFANATPAQIDLVHSSLMTVQGPVFRVKGEAVFRVEHCAIAPTGRTAMTTLVAVDDPRHLVWRGQANLYANVETFLAATDPEAGEESITTFSEWSGADLREVRTQLSATPLWKAGDPIVALAKANEAPSQAFLIDPLAAGGEGSALVAGFRQSSSPTGGRITPSPPHRNEGSPGQGAVVAADTPIAKGSGEAQPKGSRSDDELLASKGEGPSVPEAKSGSFLSPMRQPTVEPPMPVGEASLLVARGETPAPMPPMSPMPSAAEVASAVPARSGSGVAESARVAIPEKPVAPRVQAASSNPLGPAESNRSDAKGDSADSLEIRTTEELTARLKALGGKGGTLLIAANADLDLPQTILDGSGSWTIEGRPSPSGKRPRIRFKADSAGVDNVPLSWSVLFRVRSGKVRFQGLDIEIPSGAEDGDDVANERVAVFGIGKRAELSLVECTITLACRHLNLATVVVLPGGEDSRERNGSTPTGRAGRVEVRDSFIRSGGDFLALPTTPSGGLEVDLVNSLIVADGSVIHARGGVRKDGEDRPVAAEPVRLSLNRVTARTAHGLVRLESSHDEPELPFAKVDVRDSILCMTDEQDFLVRVDGHDQKIDALRDNITWVGNRVSYHQIKNYRRDQTTSTGIRPRIYNRQDWPNVARDSDSSHDDFQFKRWNPSQPAWNLTLDDFRPNDETRPKGSSNLGPDLSRIPSPPHAG